MDLKELIALVMIMGVASVGVSIPFHKWVKKKWCMVCCFLFIFLYTFLASRSLNVGQTGFYFAIGFLDYFASAFAAVLALLLGVIGSVIFDNIRKEIRVSRWLGVVVWVFLSVVLYGLVMSFHPDYIYLNSSVCLGLMIAAFVIVWVLPVLITTFGEEKVRKPMPQTEDDEDDL